MMAYGLLKQKYPNLHILLFHARFTMGDRLTRECEVLSYFGKNSTPRLREGRILVATQVVEQSLDLDFDLMVSDLAPIDLIIQRAGRVWRHVRTRPKCVTNPELCILSPIPSDDVNTEWYSSMFPGGACVYPEHGKLWKTARIFQRERKLSMPSDARRLIDEVYSSENSNVPNVLQKLDEHAQEEAFRSSGRASRRSLFLNQGYAVGDWYWTADEPALTRDSKEEEVILRIYRVVNGNVQLWNEQEDFPEIRSQVRIQRRRLPPDLQIPEEHVLSVHFKQERGEWISDEFPGIRISYSLEMGITITKT